MAQAEFTIDFRHSFKKEECDAARICEACLDPIFGKQGKIEILFRIGRAWERDDEASTYLCESCFDCFVTDREAATNG